MSARGAVTLFTLSPGDGITYRVLFGRVEVEQSLFQGYTIFGVAEGHDPIITAVLDATSRLPLLDYESRAIYEGAHNTPAQMRAIATAIYAALIDVPGIPTPAGFRTDWMNDLPNK